MAWMTIADRLGKTKEEVQERMSSTEFVLWWEYLEQEVNFFHREDYFLAQIAMLIHRCWVNESKAEIDDFLNKFETQEQKRERKRKEKKQRRKIDPIKLAQSKHFWYSAMGVYKERK